MGGRTERALGRAAPSDDALDPLIACQLPSLEHMRIRPRLCSQRAD
jgi:hypothetical protein